MCSCEFCATMRMKEFAAWLKAIYEDEYPPIDFGVK